MKKFYLLFITIVLLLSGCSVIKKFFVKELPPAPATTASVRNLIRETRDQIMEYWPKVSPDGKYVLFQTEDESKSGEERYSIMKKTIDKPGRNPVAGPFARGASWSPDGENILFVYTKPAKPVIVTTNANGVGLNYISQGPMGESDSNPVLDPKGENIVFTTKIGNSFSICTMNMKGGVFTVLTDGVFPKWHPKEHKILFNKKVGAYWQIFILNNESGQITQLTNEEASSMNPVYSHDAEWIAFSSNRDDNKKKIYHIYIMRNDGTGIKQLTSGDTNEGQPSWAPSNDIYFYSNAGNNWDIWRVEPIF